MKIYIQRIKKASTQNLACSHGTRAIPGVSETEEHPLCVLGVCMGGGRGGGDRERQTDRQTDKETER